MAKSKKGPGRPRKATGKVFPRTKPHLEALKEDVLYPAEDIMYHRTVTQERYNRTVNSIARIKPNQAITVPTKDVTSIKPASFASSVKKMISENKQTREFIVKSELLMGPGDSIKAIRFYRVK